MVANHDSRTNTADPWIDIPAMAGNNQPAQDKEHFIKQVVQILEGACAVSGENQAQHVEGCKEDNEASRKVNPEEQGDQQILCPSNPRGRARKKG